MLNPRDGAFGPWSTWTPCNWPCGGGKRNRHRFCDKPAPANGGKDCVGPRVEEEDCNTEPCPSMLFTHLKKASEIIRYKVFVCACGYNR